MTLNKIVIVFIYIQTNSIRERGSTQARHLLVIFENFENYLGQTENTLSKTESSLSKSDIFVELPIIRVQRSEDEECVTTI